MSKKKKKKKLNASRTMLPEPGSFLVRRAAVPCRAAARAHQQVRGRVTTVTALMLSGCWYIVRQSVFRFTGDACFLLSALFLHSFACLLVPQPAHMQKIENELKKFIATPSFIPNSTNQAARWHSSEQ
jgi:hypothetical protein